MLYVRLSRFGSVMRSVMQVSLGSVCVMGCYFVVSRFVVPRGFAMVSSRVFVMFGCLMMMFRCLLGHFSSSSSRCWAGGA
jgi:hypothetical protein